MRNDDIKDQYMRKDRIPDTGYLETDEKLLERIIIKDTMIAAKDSLSLYSNGSMTKPGTIPHDIALDTLDVVQRISNPNGIDREMFRGSSNREKDVISMISRLFGKDDKDDLEAGYLLSGGTESLNQVTYMLRNKFFKETLEVDVRKLGMGLAMISIVENNLKKTNTISIPRPRVLLPVNYHFCGIKGSDLLGLGTDNLAFYGLDNNFDIDEKSLRNIVESIYQEGDDIIYSLACAGDTMHGKVHDVQKISDILSNMSEKYDRKMPPIVVDAAGSFMFIGVMKNNPNYDGKLPVVSFKTKGVEAIVVDPHKQPLPYSSGLLMLKDMNLAKYTDLRTITNGGYLDLDDNDSKDATAALATIPTSRSGSNSFAIWSYLVYQGISGLRHEKEMIWGLVKEVKDYVNSSKHYELVCEPQTQVVSFRFKGTGEENLEIYKRIKCSEKDFCHISKDTEMMVRTVEELNSMHQNEYTGLFVTVMEHNNSEDIKKIACRLEEEAKYIVNSRKEGFNFDIIPTQRERIKVIQCQKKV